MIILEGPEGSGKSHLANILRLQTSLEVHHFGGPPGDIQEHEQQLERSAELLKLQIIQDRTPWISEPIYRTFFDNHSSALWGIYIAGLKAMKAYVVYCRPPDEVIRQNMCQKKKAYKSPEYEREILANADRLVSLYDDFMADLKPALQYDWTKPSSDLVLKRLTAQLNWNCANPETSRARS